MTALSQPMIVVAPAPADVWCALTPDLRSQLLRSGGVDLSPEQIVSLGDAGGVAVLEEDGLWRVGADLHRFVAQLTRLLQLTD